MHDVKVSTISRLLLHFRIYTFNGKHEDPSIVNTLNLTIMAKKGVLVS